ncbi:MAG: hypothetical protein P4M11_12325 [Candidatus Pacebacteria bacterium]|nr:hypothetical protein [Candidatus Paceibacterota bacterium]
MPPRKGKIVKIRLITIPTISMAGGCEPYFKISCGDLDYCTKPDVRPPVLTSADSIYELKLLHPVEVQDDVLVECLSRGLIGGEKLFEFWFNVGFVNEDGVLRINKRMLDKAYHDKGNKKFNKNFRVELEFVFDPRPSPSGQVADVESTLDPATLSRIMKLSDDMPCNYKKLPLV